EGQKRQKEAVDRAFVGGDGGVGVGGDVPGAYFGAALGDVARAYAKFFLKHFPPIGNIQGMHFERGGIDQEARANEFVIHMMVAQHVADVLAQVTLNALTKLLHSFDVLWGDAPGAVRRIRLSRLKLGNALLHLVIPRHIRYQVLGMRKSLHGFDGHGFIEGQRVQAGHAHQFRHAVDFGRTGTAFARLAIPADGKITGLFRLNLMDGIENHHAGGDLGLVLLELSLALLAAPDAKCCRLHYFISSITCFNSSRMGGIASLVNSSSPRSPLRATMLNFANSSSLAGKSSRKCAPRLSLRS